MLESNQLLIFVTVVLLYAFMPGPAMLYSVEPPFERWLTSSQTLCT